MPRLLRVYWRDIPMRVMVRQGRAREQVSLGPRFEVAMERAALREGKGQSHAMIDDWRTEESAVEGESGQILRAELERLQREYDDQRLKALARSCGWCGAARSEPAG